MSKTVDKDKLDKALSALEDIAKGHNSRGTNTTKVESMSGEGGATQVYHTPSNSNPKSWAGSTEEDVSENGATDSVSENGTDYAAQAKLMKSIALKLAKGQKLSAFEKAVVKAMEGEPDGDEDDKKVSKGANPFAHKEPDGDEGDEDADDKKKGGKVSKSLADFAAEDEAVSKGLEVSDFLSGFAGVFQKSIASLEGRLLGTMEREAASTGEFYKSLADAIVNLGEAVAAQAQRLDQIESNAARAPKSISQAQQINKGGFEGPGAESMTKSQVADILVDMVSKGMASSHDVLNFDVSGVLSPELEQRVRSHIKR